MADEKLEQALSKNQKKVRRLYALIWALACPLAFVVATLLGFHQMNIVYWTLLVVPALLGIYNVRQVPPTRKKTDRDTKDTTLVGLENGTENGQDAPAPDIADTEAGVSPLQHARLLTRALAPPLVIALPIFITLLVDLMLKIKK